MKGRIHQWLAVVVLLALFALVPARSSLAHTLASDSAHRAIASATSPVVKRDGDQVAVYLSPKMQAHLGIRKAPLRAARERKQMTLPATVLPVRKLAKMVSTYNAAEARLQKAEIAAGVSKREYQRLERLYREHQNVSQKAAQAAAGVYRSDRIDVHLARENLSLATAAVRRSWGAVITKWMVHDTSGLRRVLRRQDVLIEATVARDEPLAAPLKVDFRLPTGGLSYARLVSPLPQVDPRVQGVGYLYVSQAKAGLAPGLNLVARFGRGALRNGVIVPSSAVVWLYGEAWAYVATGPDRFVRRHVTTGIPTLGGWFVTQGFQPGGSVVTQDAEQILSVELKAVQPSHSTAVGGDD